MLDHRQLDRWEVENQPPILTHHEGLLQAVATDAALLRDMNSDLIWVRALHQPEPPITPLFTGLMLIRFTPIDPGSQTLPPICRWSSRPMKCQGARQSHRRGPARARAGVGAFLSATDDA